MRPKSKYNPFTKAQILLLSLSRIIRFLESLTVRPNLIIDFFTNYLQGLTQLIDNKHELKPGVNPHLPIEPIPPTSRKFSVKISVGSDPVKLVYHSLPNEINPIILRDIQIGSYSSQITFDTTDQITKFETALKQGIEGMKEAYEVLEELHAQSTGNCTQALLEHINATFLNVPEVKSNRLNSG